jgi:serine protease AprX
MNTAKGLLVCAILVFVLVTPARAVGTVDRIDPDLRARLEAAPTAARHGVIVRFSGGVDVAAAVASGSRLPRNVWVAILRDAADKAQAPARSLLAGRGIGNVKTLWLVNAMALEAPAEVIRALAALPGVLSVGLDATVKAPEITRSSQPNGTRAVDAGTVEWNISRIGAPEVWDLGFTGAGIVVASLDTGVDAEHQDLSANYRGGTNSWYDPNGEHTFPHDATGHGTQTMSILVGGHAGGTGIGVAPDALWIAAKIFDDAGDSQYSKIHEAYQWVLDPDGNPGTDDAADVVNNSWGFQNNVNQCLEEFRPDVQTLKAAGVSVVFSAGNSGANPSTSMSPANYPESFSVGATDFYSAIATFSARGPSTCDETTYPNVTAPGFDILAADLTYGGVFPDSYAYVDGTSYAAPHVGGAMALLRQAFPSATPDNLEAALYKTARDRGAAGADATFGFGIIDVAAAYDWISAGNACTDADGDGYSAPGGVGCGDVDCSDTTPGVWATPGEVVGLQFAANKQSLSWTAPALLGSVPSAARFDTLRTTSPADFVGLGGCVESNDGPNATATDSTTPALGGVFYYLVRARNVCSPGTLGTRSSGAERTGAICP